LGPRKLEERSGKKLVYILESSSKELMILKGSRGQGSKDSSEMLKNYRDLKVWPKSYGLCLDLYRITKKFPKEER
jgi:hypothetical protein